MRDVNSLFYLEAGINHFGNLKDAKKIVNFFLKSPFKNLTFMLHNLEFYNDQKLKGIDFILPENFYKQLLYLAHENDKKVGLSVCDLRTYNYIKHLNFDFFKLLSVSLTNKNLILELKKKKKPIFISTGFNATNKKIRECLKLFNSQKNLTLLHTPMTYEISNLNFQRINELKNIFNIPVGYSNHNNDFNTLNILSAYKPSCIFVYCKPTRKRNRIYPDNKHSLYLNELITMKNNYNKYNSVNYKFKKKFIIDIFKDGIKK